MRGATCTEDIYGDTMSISIHAPRAGRDGSGAKFSVAAAISIHAPRAGRDVIINRWEAMTGISIHAPRAGRDPEHRPGCGAVRISIHAPRAGRDEESVAMSRDKAIFQSTRPVRGATRAYHL